MATLRKSVRTRKQSEMVVGVERRTEKQRENARRKSMSLCVRGEAREEKIWGAFGSMSPRIGVRRRNDIRDMGVLIATSALRVIIF